MSKGERLYYLISSTTIALAVAIGAFGAHALKKIVTVDKLAVFETGVRYQMYVGLGLFGLALFKSIHKDIKLSYSFWSIFTGMIIFSGLLYLYVITGIKVFAMFVPIGGLLMILGWLGVGFKIFWKTK
jgi:uncharacterized membrane protein YgdD (TMEM256/DUF423 family)